MKAGSGEVGPFPVRTKPVREGVYRTEYDDMEGFSYFGEDRKGRMRWGSQQPDAAAALRMWISCKSAGAVQNKRWIGLAADPKKGGVA